MKKAKILFPFLMVLFLLMAAGCGKDTKKAGNKVFDPRTIKVGDKIDGFTVTEVSLNADGYEKVVFSGSFTMTGILKGNIVDGGGPNKYRVIFNKKETVNNLPVATTWDILDRKYKDEAEVMFNLHTEEKVSEAIGGVRAELLRKSMESPALGVAEYKIKASFSEFTYENDPQLSGAVFSSLLLNEILSIEDFNVTVNLGSLEELRNTKGLNIIENQSFWVEFENWGRVRFVAVENYIDVKSKVDFYLTDNNGLILYSFPDYYGNEYWHFDGLPAVAFRDVNKDGLKDVIIIAEYITGIGPQAATPFKASGIYFQKDKEFFSRPELNDEINTLGHNDSIDKIVKFMEGKDAKQDVKTKVMISVHHDKEPGGSNTILLQGLSKGEFVEMVIQGEIVEFEHVGLAWNNDTGTLQETDLINKFDRLSNKTIVINTTVPCGIPSEKIKWKSISGKGYEWIIQEDGIGDKHKWEFNLE